MLKSCVTLAVCLLVALPLSAKKKAAPPPTANPSYDASRDPAKDLQDAIAEATKTHKRILLEVGGDWCIYCNIMDETFAKHPELRKARDTNYIRVRINYSKENPNEAFLSHYPKIADYPHFFVLDSQGTLLHSQPTHPFEHGKNYNAGKIESFLTKWSQPPRHLFNIVS
jgi:thiol:disulfide interchange protein